MKIAVDGAELPWQVGDTVFVTIAGDAINAEVVGVYVHRDDREPRYTVRWFDTSARLQTEAFPSGDLSRTPQA